VSQSSTARVFAFVAIAVGVGTIVGWIATKP
jgi:hypothetical protein